MSGDAAEACGVPPGGRVPRRRQFVLGPGEPAVPEDWARRELPGGRRLATGPDLTVGEAVDGDLRVWLLGYALDPARPEAGDTEIAAALAATGGIDEVLAATNRLAGRFVVLAAAGDELVVASDAAGLRSVVYTAGPDGHVRCATEAGLLADALGFVPDRRAQREFVESAEFRPKKEGWWPGDVTPYAEIRQLLPSHALDLRSGLVRRHWPLRPVGRIGLAAAVEQGSALLERILVAGAARFSPALAVTAGWDSRVLLAASRSVRDDLWCYSLQYGELDAASPDLRVAAELLSTAGLAHHVVACPPAMSPGFAVDYRANCSYSHDYWGAIAEGIERGMPPGRVTVKGNVSETARAVYRWSGDHRVTPADLAACAALRGNRFAADAFAPWLAEADSAARAAGLHVLDLFHLEEENGRWQAQSQNEWDLVQEAFTPFNCRTLLETLLGTERRDRQRPGCLLHRCLVERLWPALLASPVNPETTGERWRRLSKRALQDAARRARVYRLLRGADGGPW